MDKISFHVTKIEAAWIQAIAARAALLYKVDQIGIEMDISACHANGNPLKLQELFGANDFEFAHDVLGIHKYIDRNTGKLTNCFLPRYSKPEAP